MTDTKLQSVSEWLSDLDSHSIYDSDAMKKDFEKATGQPAPNWPTYTPENTRRIMKARGLGGEHKPTGAAECYGFSLAAYFARTLANYSSSKMGRGSAFRDCIEALEKAGL